jgi:uncharacterized protein YbbK (DUF523 family)
LPNAMSNTIEHMFTWVNKKQLTLLYICTKSPSCFARILRLSFKGSFLLGTTTLNDC